MNKGIFIEWEFWRQKDTSLSEKAILIEINNLSMLEHGCVASNAHFSELMGIKKEAVSRLISSLEQKGYISTKIKNGSRNFSRIITINKMLFDPKQNVIAPLTNCLETKDNKTNNKTNTLLSAYIQDDVNITEQGQKEVLEFIQYRKSIKSPIKTIAPIKAYVKAIRELLSDGYKLGDIKELMREKEWQTVKPDWVKKNISKDDSEELYQW
ncbi:MAG: helix-turn-helix domain-containing protein [Sulfurimonas denitrificans]|nr:helix-turn-helix domain-containing protein [Sulfurimonas denitrificans]